MEFIQNVLPILKKKELRLKERHQESVGVYTFIFEKAQDVTWKAGQHGVFTILHQKIKKPTRVFSVASAPSEGVVRLSIGIDDTPSEFKKAMLALQPGDPISMRGPVGSFYLNEKKPALLIAGGIGITPFRAILKELEQNRDKSTKELNLHYLDSKGLFIYQEELDEVSKNIALDINYLHAREDLHKGIDRFAAQYRNTGNYYVAGPKSMVNDITFYLKDKNIAKENIKKDVFMGYR